MLAFSDFPGHVRLMLLAARSRLSAAETRQIVELAAAPPTPADTLDWDDFLAVTEHHRLSSLVYRSLDAIRPPGLPEAVLETLRRSAMLNAFEALRSTAEVRRITSVFAAAGFELSILKGVPLSQILFGSPNARHVGDIDLLTTPSGLPRQIELLAGLGYKLINPRSRLTPQRLASYVSFWKDFTFQNAETGFELDLHWRLFNNRFHAANRLLAGPAYTTVSAFSLPMRVFSLEDQFIYIAAHGVADAWTYLKSLADVAAFLRLMSSAELDRALERARSLGLLAQISAAVHLANDWMGADAGSPRLLAPGERLSRTIRERATAMLLRQNFRPERNFPSPFDWLLLEMELVPGIRSLAELASRFVWRPRVWASVDLPDSFFWVYPVLGLLLPPSGHSVEE
jgi:hypothetical protein